MTGLRGLSWDHPRGHAPLVAAADAWSQTTGVPVTWTRRSLTDFAQGELADHLGEYDLVACDHPLVGRAAQAGWLQPLDGLVDVAGLRATTVGASLDSYRHDGRLWAAPVDAAALTLAVRPDLLPGPAPVTEAELFALGARTGRVAVPLSVFSLVAIYATRCAEAGIDPFGASPDRAGPVAAMSELVSLVPERYRWRSSVELLHAMATGDDLLAVAYPYGYSWYARPAVLPGGRRLTFLDPPSSVPGAPARPTLGGVGLGLLTRAPSPALATDLLRWLTGAAAQRGVYAWAGGQPARVEAWDDRDLDALNNGFFTATRRSLEQAYVRPVAPWFERVQPRVGQLLRAHLRDGGRTDDLLARLDALIDQATVPA